MMDAAFRAMFGRPPDAQADAPGRVNLIGEHTDYSGGFVLPTAIPQRTRVAVARRGDATVRAASANAGGGAVAFELGAEAHRGGWIDYVQGIVWALREAGHAVSGFDAAIASDVPIGAGLSSSAALEVALLRALRAAFGLRVDDVTIARIGRRAENELVGAPVGIMDQMAASLGDESTALFLDTRSLAFDRLALPASAELVVIDSGIAHDHAAGEYRTRRTECERAARRLGVGQLRDADDLGAIGALPPPLDRRARHVVTENARVLEAANQMRRGDVRRLGELIDASHASMRDDFEVSVPDVDRLVALAQRHEHVLGARMTGGGFGGAIVALVEAGCGPLVADGVRAAYDAGGAPRGRVLVPPRASEPLVFAEGGEA
jgi:galactokinase